MRTGCTEAVLPPAAEQSAQVRDGLPAAADRADCPYSVARAVRRQVNTPPGSVYAGAKARERQRRHGFPK
jgi:hypothetical protein